MGVFRRFIPIGILALGCLGAAYRPSSVTPPGLSRELRAVWIATVSNIDWPSTNASTTAQQKAELLAIMDRARALKLNALIFQVRPAGDALYASTLEPWSEYLTGTMGKAPEPFYDPLAFAIDEAHKRGLELHAWFNPYRARHSAAKSAIAANHVSRSRPNLVREYGKSLWMDPGEREVQDYTLSVIIDVVRRYEIDGVHIDDYFYPYKEKDSTGKELDFPDDRSWQRFGAKSGLSRDNWRRENVNGFVHRLYSSIKETKPWVKFGVSPFGIWRPGNPPEIRGYDAFADLYADSRKWLANGWVDYFTPQLYWAIDAPEQSFPALLKWWAAQNRKNRLLAPGLDSTKAARKWPVEEILSQINLTRTQAGTGGHVHWNASALMRNPSLTAALEKRAYSEPALVPGIPWVRRATPAKPVLKLRARDNEVSVDWTNPGPEPIALWVVQTRSQGKWKTSILPRDKKSWTIESGPPDVIAVAGVDRFGNASSPAVMEKQTARP